MIVLFIIIVALIVVALELIIKEFWIVFAIGIVSAILFLSSYGYPITVKTMDRIRNKTTYGIKSKIRFKARNKTSRQLTKWITCYHPLMKC